MQSSLHGCIGVYILPVPTFNDPFLLRRAAKTLLVYLQETNPTVYSWLYVSGIERPALSVLAGSQNCCTIAQPPLLCWYVVQMYLKDNPIPLNGNWDEVSGEMFLRKMLSMQPEVILQPRRRDNGAV
jgi:hypothetical protein